MSTYVDPCLALDFHLHAETAIQCAHDGVRPWSVDIQRSDHATAVGRLVAHRHGRFSGGPEEVDAARTPISLLFHEEDGLPLAIYDSERRPHSRESGTVALPNQRSRAAEHQGRDRSKPEGHQKARVSSRPFFESRNSPLCAGEFTCDDVDFRLKFSNAVV